MRRDTPPPRTGSSETEVLRGFPDHLRNSVPAKVEDAPEPQVRTAPVPSGTNLLGLLGHLTSVERATFLGERVTDWQTTFHAAPGTAWPMSSPVTGRWSPGRTTYSTSAPTSAHRSTAPGRTAPLRVSAGRSPT